MDKIFISFKNSVNGVLTQDSRIAEALHHHLREELHLNCFFSNVSLSEAGADKYMSIIEKEILESKIMIVVSTCKDHIDHGWVRQEWLTFLNLALTDDSRRLFTYVPAECLTGLSIDDVLPPFLRPFQSFKSQNEASSFIVKSLSFENEAESVPVSKLAFWNYYFGIFGQPSRAKAMDMLNKLHISSGIKNALIGKHLIEAGSVEEGVAELKKAIYKKCICGSYLLGRYYVTGQAGEKSLDKAKQAWTSGLSFFRPRTKKSSKVLILLYTGRKRASNIFFYSELLYQVLTDHSVTVDVKLCDDSNEIEWNKYEDVVVFLNDESFNKDEEFCYSLKMLHQGVRFIINNFLEDVCPRFMRKTHCLQCDDSMITSLCRGLISKHAPNNETKGDN